MKESNDFMGKQRSPISIFAVLFSGITTLFGSIVGSLVVVIIQRCDDKDLKCDCVLDYALTSIVVVSIFAFLISFLISYFLIKETK